MRRRGIGVSIGASGCRSCIFATPTEEDPEESFYTPANSVFAALEGEEEESDKKWARLAGLWDVRWGRDASGVLAEASLRLLGERKDANEGVLAASRAWKWNAAGIAVSKVERNAETGFGLDIGALARLLFPANKTAESFEQVQQGSSGESMSSGDISGAPGRIVVRLGDSLSMGDTSGCSDPGPDVVLGVEPSEFVSRLLRCLGRDMTAGHGGNAAVVAATEAAEGSADEDQGPGVVLTIPASAGDAERQALRDAGMLSGLDVVRIINRPTAAALAHGLDRDLSGEERFAGVLHLGGSSAEFTVLSIEDGIFEVLATRLDPTLGGDRVTANLVEHCLEKIDPRTTPGPRELRRLWRACEAAKCALSTEGQVQAVIEVEGLVGRLGRGGEANSDADFRLTLSRAALNRLARPLLEQAVAGLTAVLNETGVRFDRLHNVVLAGGAANMPLLRDLVLEATGVDACRGVRPEQAVARGAGLQAVLLCDPHAWGFNEMCGLDVAPLSLGVETAGGIFSVVIPRNSTIPTRKMLRLSNFHDYQPGALIRVVEGERALACEGNCLGELEFDIREPVSRNVAEISVTFDIDANGILTVTASDSSGKEGGQRITITNDKGRLSAADIEKTVSGAEAAASEDAELRLRTAARLALESYAMALQRLAFGDGVGGTQHPETSREVLAAANRALGWLASNGSASREDHAEKLDALMAEFVLQDTPDLERLLLSNVPAKSATMQKSAAKR
jgi:heat shock 70kDa protein 1/6/8